MIRAGAIGGSLLILLSTVACSGEESPLRASVGVATTASEPSDSDAPTPLQTPAVTSPWGRYPTSTEPEFEMFRSLRQMVRAADITTLATVVSGRVEASAGPGRTHSRELLLRLRPDELLAGRRWGETRPLILDLGPVGRNDGDRPWQPYVGSQAIFVLRRSGARIVNGWGTLPRDPALLAQHHYHVISSTGLLEEMPNGAVTAPRADAVGWITRVVGRPFEGVLDSIRAADD